MTEVFVQLIQNFLSLCSLIYAVSSWETFPSQQYVNWELSDVPSGFRKGRGTRDQIANIRWIIEKTREFQKSMYFCFIDYAKAFDCVDHNKLWKFFKSWEYQTTWPASWEIYVQVKKHQLELDMEQQTGSKLGKECVKADIVTLLIAGWCEELTHLKRPWWWER